MKELSEHKKYVSSEKESEFCMKELAGSAQNHGKISGAPKQPIETKNFPKKKTMFSALKMKRSHQLVWGLPV
jgi:hypothetical protein